VSWRANIEPGPEGGRGDWQDVTGANLAPDDDQLSQELVAWEGDEVGPTVVYDDPDGVGEADFYHPALRRRWRSHVRRETRLYSRALRGRQDSDATAFSFYPPRQAEMFNAMRAVAALGPWEPEPGKHRLHDPRSTPWPFEPQLETWEDEAVIPLPLGPELTGRQERVLNVMAVPRGGFNGGRAAPMDGTEPGFSRDGWRRLPELGPEGMARTEFLRGGGWQLERREPTGEAPGRRRVDVVLSSEDQEDLIEQVGVDRETWSRLFRQGPKTRADREARAWVESSVAELMRAARGLGIEKALMQTYGCSRRTLHNIARRGRG
jgi:hypothetical protein